MLRLFGRAEGRNECRDQVALPYPFSGPGMIAREGRPMRRLKFWLKRSVKKIAISLAMLIFTVPAGAVLKGALAYWGILDPLAADIGLWLKMQLGASLDTGTILWA